MFHGISPPARRGPLSVGETSAFSSMSMLRTLRMGAKSVEWASSRSNRSMASPSRIGSEKRAKTPKPLGPMSMIVPTGESTMTCPALVASSPDPRCELKDQSGESSMSHLSLANSHFPSLLRL